MTREVEARFARIERNLELTAAINADTALLAKHNEEAIKRLIALVEVFVRGRSNGGKSK